MRPMKSFVQSRLIQLKDLISDQSSLLQGGVVFVTGKQSRFEMLLEIALLGYIALLLFEEL